VRRSRIVGFGLALTATLSLTVSCTVGPSARPGLVVAGNSAAGPSSTPSGRVRPLPPLEQAGTQISWSDCADQTKQRLGSAAPADLTYQCGQVLGPLDPNGNDPNADDEVRIELLKAGTGATPLLVLNDLSGLPGTLYAAELAGRLPAAVLRQFSLIGVDRRGTGASDGVHCLPQADRDQIVGADPASTDLDALLSANLDGSQQCVLDLDTRAAALNTQNSVADLELIRQQLGVNYLNAIGHGEGSRVLTVYADQHPDRVGRFVLDGAPDPGSDSTAVAQARAGAAETTFAAFAADCVDRGNCPLGGDPKSTFSGLLSQLRQQPLSTPDGKQLGPGFALHGVLSALADRSQWPTLASAIAAAQHGDGAGLAALVAPIRTGGADDPPRLDAELVSGCNDLVDRPAPAQVSALITAWGRLDPLFGAVYAQRLLWCAPWPVPDQQLPRPSAPGTPPILVLSTANDPVTPAAGSERTATDLVNGVLVDWQGSGHGAIGVSSCATNAVTGFLVTGTVPQNNTTCPP
jgi:pimeloyl-ACP methyl ester carboxylesterase